MNKKNVHGCLCQDRLLEQLRQAKILVSLYLRSGVKLEGIIANFDSNVILLREINKDQMIFKHAVLSIVPSLSVHE